MTVGNELAEELIRQWILSEAAAESIITHTPEGYIFQGERNDYYVELKVYRVPTRLSEPAIDLAYD